MAMNLVNPFRFSGGGGGGNPADYFSNNFTEGWWPTDDNATMFQTRGAETTAVSDGDVVGTITSEGGTPYLTTDLDVTRPTWSDANNALVYDGVDDRMFVSIPEVTRGTDMYAAYVVYRSTDAQFAIIGSSISSDYVGFAANGSMDTAVNQDAGTPTIKIDGVTFAGSTLDDLSDAIPITQNVLLEAIGFDMTAAGWTKVYFGTRSNSSLLGGRVADPYLAENTADVRANVPGILAARHGITL